MEQTKYLEIPVESIVFEEGRQRQTYDDIEELAESIKEKGLLQPIGVEDKTRRLVWGGRRLKAIKSLGLTKVPCRIVPQGLSLLELEEIELEENIQRKDLTWQERVQAVKRIDTLKKQLHGDQSETRDRSSWSTRKTADLVGKSSGGVADDIKLAEMLELMPELANCKTADEARKAAKRAINTAAMKKLVERTAVESSSTAFKFANRHYVIGDAIEGLKSLEQTRATFAVVDPPYGVRLKEQKRTSRELSEYEEVSGEEYPRLIKSVATELYRVLAEHAWVVWWFGQERYQETFEIVSAAGFKVDPIPAVWYKLDRPGQSNHPEVLLGRAYETFFVCRKGVITLPIQGRSNVFAYSPVAATKKIHPTEKPLDLMLEIFKTFTYPNTIVIIPFLGSGVDLRAAYCSGMTGFGWDLSEEYKQRFLYKVGEDIEVGRYK